MDIYCLNFLSIYVYICNIAQGAFLEKVRSENPGMPCFLFGHSTGGAVVLKVWILQEFPSHHMPFIFQTILLNSAKILIMLGCFISSYRRDVGGNNIDFTCFACQASSSYCRCKLWPPHIFAYVDPNLVHTCVYSFCFLKGVMSLWLPNVLERNVFSVFQFPFFPLSKRLILWKGYVDILAYKLFIHVGI